MSSHLQIPWHIRVKGLKLSVRLYKPCVIVAATALSCLCSFGEGGGGGFEIFFKVSMINHTFPLILPGNS